MLNHDNLSMPDKWESLVHGLGPGLLHAPSRSRESRLRQTADGVDAHRLLPFGQRRAQPSMSRPLAAIQLPATRTTIRAHWRRRGMTNDVKIATTTKTAKASPNKE
jgi:hypothetical protein